MVEDIRPFIRNMIQSVFKVKLENHKDISMPVVLAVGAVEDAIKEKRDIDESKIASPIVEAIAKASKDTIKEIRDKEIPNVVTVENFPEFPQAVFDTAPIVEELRKISGKEEKDIIFNEKEVDFSGVITAIKDIKIPESKDYSEAISGLKDAISEKDDKLILEELKKITTTEDISVLAEWLKVIAEKEYPVVDFPRDNDGIPLFNPTRVGGGGGGGLTTAQEATLNSLATSDKQDSQIAKQDSQIVKQDSQIALETTLNSLVETLQELTSRLNVIASMANAGQPALRTIPIGSVSTAVTGTVSLANFGSGVTGKEVADDINNQMIHLCNINNVTAS